MKKILLLFLLLLTLFPSAVAYYGVSPYAYCAGDPVNRRDVDGKDARVTIDGNNITISAAIVLTGPNATDELAGVYRDGLEKTWGKLKSFTDANGKAYNVSFQFEVSVDNSIDLDKGVNVPEQDGYHNYMQVVNVQYENGSSNYASSGVNKQTGYTGHIRAYGVNFMSLAETNPMSHEFGHMLGLVDRYSYLIPETKAYPIADEGWEGQIMAEDAGAGTASVRSITGVLVPLLYYHHYLNSAGVASWSFLRNYHLGNTYYKEKK